VLNLGFLMTSYFKWTGLTEAEVSVYRGIGALVGGAGGSERILMVYMASYLYDKNSNLQEKKLWF
jgi:hypothetical protein